MFLLVEVPVFFDQPTLKRSFALALFGLFVCGRVVGGRGDWHPVFLFGWARLQQRPLVATGQVRSSTSPLAERETRGRRPGYGDQSDIPEITNSKGNAIAGEVWELAPYISPSGF